MKEIKKWISNLDNIHYEFFLTKLRNLINNKENINLVINCLESCLDANCEGISFLLVKSLILSLRNLLDLDNEHINLSPNQQKSIQKLINNFEKIAKNF